MWLGLPRRESGDEEKGSAFTSIHSLRYRTLEGSREVIHFVPFSSFGSFFHSFPTEMDFCGSITGKLHINYNDDDIIIHCTDNPGRVTFLRTRVQQVLKHNGKDDFKEAYFECISHLILVCNVRNT